MIAVYHILMTTIVEPLEHDCVFLGVEKRHPIIMPFIQLFTYILPKLISQLRPFLHSHS